MLSPELKKIANEISLIDEKKFDDLEARYYLNLCLEWLKKEQIKSAEPMALILREHYGGSPKAISLERAEWNKDYTIWEKLFCNGEIIKPFSKNDFMEILEVMDMTRLKENESGDIF